MPIPPTCLVCGLIKKTYAKVSIICHAYVALTHAILKDKMCHFAQPQCLKQKIEIAVVGETFRILNPSKAGLNTSSKWMGALTRNLHIFSSGHNNIVPCEITHVNITQVWAKSNSLIIKSFNYFITSTSLLPIRTNWCSIE